MGTVIGGGCFDPGGGSNPASDATKDVSDDQLFEYYRAWRFTNDDQTDCALIVYLVQYLMNSPVEGWWESKGVVSGPAGGSFAGLICRPVPYN